MGGPDSGRLDPVLGGVIGVDYVSKLELNL
jgi:hypothetical protein